MEGSAVTTVSISCRRSSARDNAPLCAPRSSTVRNRPSTSSRRSRMRSATSLCRKSTQPFLAARSRCNRQARRSNSPVFVAVLNRRASPGRGAYARHPSSGGLAGTNERRGMAVDECAHSLMMCRDAGIGNLYREDFRSAATDRSGARRRRVATSLPFLRRDRRSARCLVRSVLGWHHFLRAALVRALRSALSPSHGRGRSLRQLCA